MRNKYRHLVALSLMVFSLSLISCTVNDFSSSSQSTSSSTTTTSQNDDKLSFQINIPPGFLCRRRDTKIHYLKTIAVQVFHVQEFLFDLIYQDFPLRNPLLYHVPDPVFHH